MEITKDIRYIGVDDHDIDLFEGQYDVSENGMAYNSYVILGDKIAVADSVDAGFVDEWLGNLEAVLDGRTPTIWSSITWSPITPPVSPPLWSAIPRRRLWPAWALSA